MFIQHTLINNKHFSLFELMLYVPFNCNGNVGTLPPILWDFYPTCHDTQNVLHKYNHPSKPIRLTCMDGLTKPLFLGRLRLEWLTSI